MTTTTIPSNSSIKCIPYSVNIINGSKNLLSTDGNTYKIDITSRLFSSGESHNKNMVETVVTSSAQDTRSLNNLTKIAHNNCFHFRTRSLPLTDEPFVESFPSTTPTTMTPSTTQSASSLSSITSNIESISHAIVMDAGNLPSRIFVDQITMPIENGISIIDKLCGKNNHIMRNGNHHFLQPKSPYSHNNRYQRYINQKKAIATIASSPNTVTIGAINSSYSQLSSFAISKSAAKGFLFCCSLTKYIGKKKNN